MKTIYLDSDFCCHLMNDGTRRAVETDAFDGKCTSYIEGYRYIPDGESWTRSDGAVFNGLMISPAEDYSRLEKAQRQYELDEVQRWESLDIPQEQDFTATRNYPVNSFLAIQGQLYETTRAIPAYTSINNTNVVKTTIEHYFETIEEDK